MKSVSRLIVLLVAAAFLSPSVSSGKGLEVQIEIVESDDMDSWAFSPSTLTVPVGTTVVWRNTGRETHSVTSRDQLFDSRLLDSDDEWSHTFETPGTYRYFCVPHPWMKGTVVVVADEPERRGSRSSSSSNTDSSSQSSSDTDASTPGRSSSGSSSSSPPSTSPSNSEPSSSSSSSSGSQSSGPAGSGSSSTSGSSGSQ